MKGLLLLMILVLFTSAFIVLVYSMIFGYDKVKEKMKDWLRSIYDRTSIF